jgi:membrane dipeptidase
MRDARLQAPVKLKGREPMPAEAMVPVFDGHNDILFRLNKKATKTPERDFIDGDGEGHLDLPRMLHGGFAGGLFAVYVPPKESPDDLDDLMTGERYDVPLAPLLEAHDALPTALAMVATLVRMERASHGKFKICRTAAEIRACLAKGTIAAVLHMEGAEAIDRDLHSLDVFYQAGLRSLGPVWSRPTIFGHGVPFRFPSTGDTGPGLTDVGKELIKACNHMGVAIDLSHMTEKGFWDVAKLSSKPLIASHSNANAICPHSRNLSDKQLAAIKESGGLVGLNFATCFLRPDGQKGENTPIEPMVRHLDHLIAKLGVEHVGFGSDFDGAQVPEAIGDVAGLPVLVAALRQHGFDEATLNQLCHTNWIDVLERSWRAVPEADST